MPKICESSNATVMVNCEGSSELTDHAVKRQSVSANVDVGVGSMVVVSVGCSVGVAVGLEVEDETQAIVETRTMPSSAITAILVSLITILLNSLKFHVLIDYVVVLLKTHPARTGLLSMLPS